jgi:hypothetical protein
MERAAQASEFLASDLPPKWDADKDRAQRARGPFEAFAAPAIIFAGIAGAFSRQPAINVLSAGASAMNAIQRGRRSQLQGCLSGVEG